MKRPPAGAYPAYVCSLSGLHTVSLVSFQAAFAATTPLSALLDGVVEARPGSPVR